MSERTALEVASRLEALMPICGRSAVKALRQQHAEIERLRETLAGDHEDPWAENRRLRRYVGNNMLMSDFRNVDEMRAEIDRLKRERHHIYDLLARIHRDGGQYTAENGVEKSCDDAEARIVLWIDTISGIDSLIEQARIAEREECAVVCDDLGRMVPGTKSSSMLHFAAKRIRARSAK